MSGYAPSCGTQSETSFSQTFLRSQCHFPKTSLISLQNNTVCPTHGTCKECNLIHTTKCILCDRFTISATLSFVIRIFYLEEKRRTFSKSKQHPSFCDPRNHRNEKPITCIAQILALTDDFLDLPFRRTRRATTAEEALPRMEHLVGKYKWNLSWNGILIPFIYLLIYMRVFGFQFIK